MKPLHRLFPPAAALAALALLLPATPALAGNDGFAGTWKRNLDDTELPGGAPPTPMDATVEVDGDDIHVVINNRNPDGDETVKFTYTPSDTPYSIPAGGDRTRDVTMKWSGGKVVVKYKFKIPGQNMEADAVETWRLKKGGKRIFVKTSMRAPVGTFVSKDYWDRVKK